MPPYNHPKELWLSPWCDDCAKHDNEGRLWCEHNVFNPCEECGQVAERYVLAPEQESNLVSHSGVAVGQPKLKR